MTVKGDNQFTQPGSYFFLLLLVVFLLLQMKLLNAGLERGDALFVVPIYQVRMRMHAFQKHSSTFGIDLFSLCCVAARRVTPRCVLLRCLRRFR